MKTSKKILGVLLAAMALFALPATASAAPFNMSIDNAILDLGGLSGVRAIDSELSDPPATLAGDLTGNTVNVPKAGFVFPTKSAEVSPGITADINMEANEDMTGTFDAGTGQLVIDASLKATVAVLGSNCVISPIELTLSSDNAEPYLGQEFSSGIEGQGVISASWTGLPPVTGGGACGVVSQLIAGAGGIAMSHGIHDIKTCATDSGNPRCDIPNPAPTVKPKIVTSPPATTTADVASFSFEKGDGETANVTGFECVLDGGAPQACDSGSKTYTGLAKGSHTFQVKATNSGGAGPAAEHTWEVQVVEEPGAAKFGALSVKPKAKKVKRGKRITIVAKVRNTGDGAASGVKICVTAPKKLVRVKRCVNKGTLAAGGTATAKFKVVVNRKAKKGRKAALRFVATGKDATSGNALAKKAGRAVVRIG